MSEALRGRGEDGGPQASLQRGRFCGFGAGQGICMFARCQVSSRAGGRAVHWCHRWWQVAGGKSADMPELELTVTYKLNISNPCRRGAVRTSWKGEAQR